MTTALFMSIHPDHANAIMDGTKKAELRRTAPQVSKNAVVLVYSTSPVRSLIGASRVERIVHVRISRLWQEVKATSGLSKVEFDAYFEGKDLGVGIILSRSWRLKKPLGLRELRKLWAGFHPPQAYRYVCPKSKGGKKLLDLVLHAEQESVTAELEAQGAHG